MKYSSSTGKIIEELNQHSFNYCENNFERISLSLPNYNTFAEKILKIILKILFINHYYF